MGLQGRGFEHASVGLVGVTAHPDGSWTSQQAATSSWISVNMSPGFRFLVRDRAGQFTASFDAVLASAGIDVVKIPPRCPRANCFAERHVLTVRTELTDRMLIFGERQLRGVLARYSVNYNGHRPPSSTATASATSGNAGLRAGPRQDPTSTDSRRLGQPVRVRGLETADQQPWPSSGTPVGFQK